MAAPAAGAPLGGSPTRRTALLGAAAAAPSAAAVPFRPGGFDVVTAGDGISLELVEVTDGERKRSSRDCVT